MTNRNKIIQVIKSLFPNNSVSVHCGTRGVAKENSNNGAISAVAPIYTSDFTVWNEENDTPVSNEKWLDSQYQEEASINPQSKYLRITVHDNDFTSFLVDAAKILYDKWDIEEKFPDENNIEDLKKSISYIACGSMMACDMLFYTQNGRSLHSEKKNDYERYLKYLTPELKIVEYADIEDWENYECVYVPLFSYADIIVR